MANELRLSDFECMLYAIVVDSVIEAWTSERWESYVNSRIEFSFLLLLLLRYIRLNKLYEQYPKDKQRTKYKNNKNIYKKKKTAAATTTAPNTLKCENHIFIALFWGSQ